MNPAEEAPPKKRDSSNRGAIIVIAVIFGLIFYALSPVIVMLNYPAALPSGPTGEVLRTFFLPVAWLYKNVEIVEMFYDFIFEWVENTFL